MLNVVPLEVLVLCNEPLEFNPVNLFICFPVAALGLLHFPLKVISKFGIQLLEQFLLGLGFELSFKILFILRWIFNLVSNPLDISIDPLTCCVAVESANRVLLNTISAFQAAFDLIL